MILIRRCNALFKTKITYTTIFANDFMFFIANSYKNPVAHTYCITATYVDKFNIKNIRNLSISDNVYNIENFQTKLVILNKSIDNKVVNLNLLTSIIEDLKTNDYQLSETSSLMLISCCGNVLYNEPLKVRQELINRIWNILKEGTCKLTIEHYHALLQVYIDNDQIIDPKEFLKSMTVTPDYNTYCLLLKVPCTNDSAFTDSILSNLQQNTISSGDRIYNALLYAYAVHGNTKGIENTITLMKERGIEQSATEVYLMYTNARNGNIEALIDGLESTKLPISHIMQLVKQLSLSGNGEHIPTVLKYMEPLMNEDKSITYTIAQLVQAGHVLNAYKVVTHVPINDKFQDVKENLLLCFLEVMINANGDPNVVLKVTHNLEKDQSNINIWEKVIELALEHNNETLAFKVLEEMKATNVALDSHHYWPLFLYAQKQSHGLDVYSVMKHMIALDVKIDSKTLIDYVFPHIDTRKPIRSIEKLYTYGIKSGTTVEPFIKFLLNTGRLKESMTVCSYFKKKVDCQHILDSLYLDYKKSKDINSYIHFLFNLTYNGYGFVAPFIQKVLNEPEFNARDAELLHAFLIASLKYKAVISPIDAQHLEQKLSSMNLKEEFKSLLTKLIDIISTNSRKQNYNVETFIHPQYMNFDQLYAHFCELKQAKHKNVRGMVRKLLIAACHMNNLKLVNELLAEIEENNFTWTASMRLNLFDFYVKCKMSEKALAELVKVRSQFQNVNIDNFKILKFAKLLVDENKINQALDTINNCTSVNQKPEAYAQIHNLLFSLIENNYPEYVERMVNLLIKRKYYKDTSYVYRYLILADMIMGNMESAVNRFSNCVVQFNKTPAKQEILEELIKANSSSKYNDLSKKVHEHIVKVHGKGVADVNLAVAYALSNKITELQHLFKTSNMKENLISSQLKYLTNDKIIKTTLAILEATGDTAPIRLNSICNLALSVYDNQGNCEQAMKLWETMLSKGIQPDKYFQETFTKLLKTHKFSVHPQMKSVIQ